MTKMCFEMFQEFTLKSIGNNSIGLHISNEVHTYTLFVRWIDLPQSFCDHSIVWPFKGGQPSTNPQMD